MKHKYSLNPKEFDLGGTEKFYSDMAAKGWKLVSRGVFLSRFEKSEPEAVRYRIEIVSPKLLENGKLPEEQVGIYEDCGWEYVTGRGFHHVFRAPDDSDAPEFYLDPAQQAETLQALRKQYIWNAMIPLVYVLLFTILSFFRWNVADGHWFAAFYQSWVADTYLIIGDVLILFGLVFRDVWGMVYLSRLYHKMQKGIPLNHESDGRHYFLRLAQWTITIVGLGCLCWDTFCGQTFPMPLETKEPYILLKELGVSGERTTNHPYSDRESEVVYKKSLLAESWTAQEFVQDQQWLHQKVYILQRPGMMEQFVESLMYNSTFGRSPDNFTEIEIQGLDHAWVSKSLECIAVKDNKAIILTHLWESSEEMTDSLQRIAQKWAATD